MSKIAIEEVEAKLLEKHFDPIKVAEIVKELEEVAEEIKADNAAAAGPKQKWEYVIVLNDKEGFLTGKEIAGWVVQQEADADAGLVLGKLKDAAKSQNEAAKRKKHVMTNLVELFEGLKAKFTKEKKIRIKTKELTRVLITNGKF
jgi:hypothetical protein